jgi:hypothetical protein
MDANRFETLIRSVSKAPSRRGALRLLAGSVLGSLLTFDEAVVAKRKRKKKRCKNLGDGCTPGGKRKCCGELICSTIGKGIGLEGPERCCKQPGEPCTVFDDCCSAFCLNDGAGTPGTCLDT